MARLLIIACSEKKSPVRRRLGAIDRYDGPTFRVLRRFLREHPEEELAVWILSAKFGLIPAEKQILTYDMRMTRKRAQELRNSVNSTLKTLLTKIHATQVGLCLGKTYLLALDHSILSKQSTTYLLKGGLGKRLTALKSWLQYDFDSVQEMVMSTGEHHDVAR